MRKNVVLDYMERNQIPLTRKNYLDLAYLGRPPRRLDGEEEAEVPDEVKGGKEESEQ